MPRTISTTVTGVADSPTLALNLFQEAPIAIAVQVQCGSACTYTVQYTLEEPLTASPPWCSDTNATDQTADILLAIDAPITGVRLHQTAGSATSTLLVKQAGGV